MKTKKRYSCFICRQSIMPDEEYDWIYLPGYRGLRRERVHRKCSLREDVQLYPVVKRGNFVGWVVPSLVEGINQEEQEV
ncbi:hypothetical protein J7M23_01615 [Candidatus Sumerlaeota bacterium]|nr:hypothetical protein [Candidatus Sumerlaeota bacterium]